MLFQTFDTKLECVGFYCGGDLSFDMEELPSEASATWNYVPYLRDHDVDFVSLYLEGQDVKKHLPEYLLDDWEDITSQLKAHKRCLDISQVDLNNNCFYDLVPRGVLVDWAIVKNNITRHIIKTIEKPRRYEFYKRLTILAHDISRRTIRLDHRLLKSVSRVPKHQNIVAKLLSGKRSVEYNVFGTKTGRLSTRPKSFPILTLPKSIRSAVLPSNDCFVEIDFNGAEVRVLLGMLGKDQPLEDVHEFHRREVFGGEFDREKAKQSFFAWLYGSRQMVNSNSGKRLEAFYDKGKVLSQYWHEGIVSTLYGKNVGPTDQHHALNYIVQSTTAELALKQFLKIDYLLRSKSTNSDVAFLIHDAIILDMNKDDLKMLPQICALMGSTNFGTFPLNIKKGTNLGNMKKVSLDG